MVTRDEKHKMVQYVSWNYTPHPKVSLFLCVCLYKGILGWLLRLSFTLEVHPVQRLSWETFESSCPFFPTLNPALVESWDYLRREEGGGNFYFKEFEAGAPLGGDAPAPKQCEEQLVLFTNPLPQIRNLKQKVQTFEAQGHSKVWPSDIQQREKRVLSFPKA